VLCESNLVSNHQICEIEVFQFLSRYRILCHTTEFCTKIVFHVNICTLNLFCLFKANETDFVLLGSFISNSFYSSVKKLWLKAYPSRYICVILCTYMLWLYTLNGVWTMFWLWIFLKFWHKIGKNVHFNSNWCHLDSKKTSKHWLLSKLIFLRKLGNKYWK
jgi:hypothetical protein